MLEDALVKLAHPRLRQAEALAHLVEGARFGVAKLEDGPIALAQAVHCVRKQPDRHPALQGRRGVVSVVVIWGVPTGGGRIAALGKTEGSARILNNYFVSSPLMGGKGVKSCGCSNFGRIE